jgi:hypothetical protein
MPLSTEYFPELDRPGFGIVGRADKGLFAEARRQFILVNERHKEMMVNLGLIGRDDQVSVRFIHGPRRCTGQLRNQDQNGRGVSTCASRSGLSTGRTLLGTARFRYQNAQFRNNDFNGLWDPQGTY